MTGSSIGVPSIESRRTEFLLSVLDQLDQGVYFVDCQRRITLWNRAAETITGWPAGAVIGRRCADGVLRHCDETGHILCGCGCPLLAAMSDGQERSTQAFLLHRSGARIPVHVKASVLRDEEGNIVGSVEVFSNNSGQLASLEELGHLRNAAMMDPLTSLPNRRFLDERRTARVLEEARHLGQPAALLFIDLDHFKRINDTYGHEMGDEVLRVAATTLRSNLRPLDLIARWGGEEFVIVATGLAEESLRLFAERLRSLVERCEIGRPTHDLRVTASIGCTVAREGETWSELTARADRLMYESKERGRNRVTLG